MELVFATNNAHKVQEVQQMVGELFEIKSLESIGCLVDIPETGLTMEENSLQKSRYVLDNYGISCFADDSGLEIEALNGEPGVFSARYSGSRDMSKNIALVLEKLQGVSNRNARFRTVISLILDGETHVFEGLVEGVIIDSLRGSNGFGYDPIFIPKGHELTFAEMSNEQKSSMSHRGEAIRKMIEFLNLRF